MRTCFESRLARLRITAPDDEIDLSRPDARKVQGAGREEVQVGIVQEKFLEVPPTPNGVLPVSFPALGWRLDTGWGDINGKEDE